MQALEISGTAAQVQAAVTAITELLASPSGSELSSGTQQPSSSLLTTSTLSISPFNAAAAMNAETAAQPTAYGATGFEALQLGMLGVDMMSAGYSNGTAYMQAMQAP